MKIGEYNELRVARLTDHGAFLADEAGDEVLLPRRYMTPYIAVGTTVSVFVYTDSDDRRVATTLTPVAVVGQFALMRVKAVNAVGAFLDWGLEGKDLLVPFSEQRVKMQVGRSYVVRVLLDHATSRVVASAKLDRFLGAEQPQYYHRQRVSILIVQRTELGYKVIVNSAHWGLLYQNEMAGDVNVGEVHEAFVKQVRPDGKIDITTKPIEKMRVDSLASRVLEHMRRAGGAIPLTDRSTPEQIAAAFGCSKKDFKKALGQLYREHRVALLPDQTIIVEQ